jgi:hypothetical protein
MERYKAKAGDERSKRRQLQHTMSADSKTIGVMNKGGESPKESFDKSDALED